MFGRWRIVVVLLIVGGLLLIPEKGRGVLLPNSQGAESSALIVGYEQGVLVLKFKEPLNLDSAKQPQIAGIARIGVASVDALNLKYGVTKIEKLFPGEEPPAPGSLYADLSRYYTIEFPAQVNLDEIAADYSKDPFVVTAEQCPITKVDDSRPNDPYFTWPEQWSLDDPFYFYDLDMPEAWDYERGDSAVILGIIDTGILRTHIDLGGTSGNNYLDGNIWYNWKEYNGVAGVDDDTNGYVDDWRGWDFVTSCYPSCWPGEDGAPYDNDPLDFNGHGSHVSGIAAAITNNSKGIAGIAGGWYTGQRGCKLMALRIGYSAPDINDPSIEQGYVQSIMIPGAINYARRKGVTAINMSFGIADLSATKDAVRNALLDGIIVVHSAGNGNTNVPSVIDTMTVLGTTNRVIAAASTDMGGTRSSYSNFGSWVTVSAPGSSIRSTYSSHYTQAYADMSGTSMSSPHIVGLAGLMKSAFPNATGEQIREWIVTTTDSIDQLNPGYEGLLGSGLINANNFFSKVPVAQFAATSPVRGHVPFTVSFADSSKGPVDSLFWDFGDGGTSVDTNPSHIYTAPGRFTVRQLAWSDSFGLLYGIPSVERKDNLIFVIADSMYSVICHGAPGESKIPVPIYYRNIYPVTDLTIPIRFSGAAGLKCDSVGFKSSRIVSFLVKSGSIDNDSGTILISASDFTPLAPGAGLLGTAYFSLDSSSLVGDTAYVDTAIIGSSTLLVTSTDPQMGIYDPKFIGTILAIESWPRGDVSKNGRLDLPDAIQLVNYIFDKDRAATGCKGTDPGNCWTPDPLWLGDFNVSNNIELADVIQIVNRIFKGI